MRGKQGRQRERREEMEKRFSAVPFQDERGESCSWTTFDVYLVDLPVDV